MLDLSDHCESLKRLADDEKSKNNVNKVNAPNAEYLHLGMLPLMMFENDRGRVLETSNK